MSREWIHRFASGLSLLAIVAVVVDSGPPQGDFANYYTGAALWWEGAPLERMVDYRWFTEQASRLGFEDRLVGWPVLTPPSVLLAAPLLALGPVAAGWVWNGLSGIASACLAWAIARGARLPVWFGVALMFLVWPAWKSHLVQGQAHLPVILLVALGYLAYQRRFDAAAGILWAVAIGLKVHAWPVLLVVAMLGRWRVVRASVGTLVGCGLVSVALLGWPLHATFFGEIAPAASAGWYLDPFGLGLQSIGIALRRMWVFHPGLNPEPISDLPRLVAGVDRALLFAGVGTVVVLARWLRPQGDTSEQVTLLLAASTVTALTFGSLLARYHLLALLPPVAWACGIWWHQRRWLPLVSILLLSGAAVWLPVPRQAEGLFNLLAIPRFWMMLSIWMILVLGAGAGRLSLRSWLFVALLSLSAGGATAWRWDGARSEDDRAVAVDHPSFPLIAADLTMGLDGQVMLSGLSANRGDLPGRGWMGYHIDAEQSRAQPVEGDAHAHVWSPVVVGDRMHWGRGPGELPSARDAVGPDGGRLEVRQVNGQSDIFWVGSQEERRLTTDPSHDSNPVWDPKRQRVWFLSDRGSGARALRLWFVQWP